MTFQKPKHYNPDIQIDAMRRLYPQFTVERNGTYDIEFKGKLRVKPWFPEYTIAISYRGEKRPLVRVVKPRLVSVNCPHFYEDDKSLCLYHPDNFRWAGGKLIAREIMHWTAAWIYYYEVWLEKGIWYGPEFAHGGAN